ncbi:restriction endonuclease [Mumia sp. ZJ1417]|uniref:HNH endonuclease n=1 Tax=Mumia sp. ZJ1417 TaxID=2708082 RepID=UPI00141FED08|nr:HNH endonuclease [Mumia sp. ZJ1417]QMW64919.1 restriction endonuclease [Mumia sp. ZJ1417]
MTGTISRIVSRVPLAKQLRKGTAPAKLGFVTDLSVELLKREALMHAIAAEFTQTAVLTSKWLGRVDFGFGPERIKDVGKGIWNPASYAGTLTIVSDPDGEYDDGAHGDSLYRYAYEKRPAGQDPRGGSNVKLRRAMQLGLPIIMLRKIHDGQFAPVMPVYVVKEEPEHQRFLLALDESLRFLPDPAHLTEDQRRYVERVVRQRLHQPEFRARVLGAYELKCAVCDLKKAPLIDAAHITADGAEDGLPVVANGLALCKIHHAAYDENILGISPDYVVHINGGVLSEVDGPMLKYGLQQMDRRALWVPRRAAHRPDKERLAHRFEAFKDAG